MSELSPPAGEARGLLELATTRFRVVSCPLTGSCPQHSCTGEAGKRCAVCGAALPPNPTGGKYCPDCAAKVRRRKEAERQRKRYQLSTHLRVFKPL